MNKEEYYREKELANLRKDSFLAWYQIIMNVIITGLAISVSILALS